MEFDKEYFTDSYIGYKNYGDRPHFLLRAQWIINYYNFLGITGKIYILGCGYGYTIKHLIDLGFDSAKIIGIDSSLWAYSQSTNVGVQENIVYINATNYGWGFVDNDDLIISWSFFDCLDQTTAESLIPQLNTTDAKQVHMMSIDDISINSEDYKTFGYYIKPLIYWQDLFTVTGTILITEEGLVYRRANSQKWDKIDNIILPIVGDKVSD